MKLAYLLRVLYRAIGFSRCLVFFALIPSVGFAGDTTPAAQASATSKTDAKDMKEITAPVEKSTSPVNFRIGTFLWQSEMSGSVGARGVVSDAKYIPFNDLEERLDYAIPGSIEVGYGKWGVLLEGQYTKLQETLEPPRGIFLNPASVDMEQAFADFNVSYKVVDQDGLTLSPFIGTRFEYIRIHAQASTTGVLLGQSRTFQGSSCEAWADPILGFQAAYKVFNPCTLLVKADVGGFGAASHLTYQAFGGIETQVTRCFYMSLGYRYLQTNYTSGGFTYNIAFSGPQISLGFNF
jgi:opacity protein-like surface antigen